MSLATADPSGCGCQFSIFRGSIAGCSMLQHVAACHSRALKCVDFVSTVRRWICLIQHLYILCMPFMLLGAILAPRTTNRVCETPGSTVISFHCFLVQMFDVFCGTTRLLCSLLRMWRELSLSQTKVSLRSILTKTPQRGRQQDSARQFDIFCVFGNVVHVF